MNLIKQFAEHLEFMGLGRLNDDEQVGDIYWGTMPEKPDNCICVYSTDSGYGGSENGARVQVIVRGLTTKFAYEKCQEITEALVDFEGYLAGDGAYVNIEVMNSSAGLGSDTKKRELYSSNFRVRYCNY